MFLYCLAIDSSLFTPLAAFLGIVVSAIIAVFSWRVIAKNNQKHEIFKKRIDIRISTFRMVHKLFYTMSIFSFKEVETYTELSKRISSNLMICGNKNEIKLWYEFEAAYADYLVNKEDNAKEKNAIYIYLKVKQEFTKIIREEIGTEPL